MHGTATTSRRRPATRVVASGGVTPVKLAAHAALAGLYGGLLVVLLLALMNPGGWPGDGAGLAGLLAVSLTWIYAAVIGLAPPLRRIGWLQASAAALALLGLVAAAWEGGGGLEDSGPAAPAPAPAAARTPAHHLVLLNFDGADFDTVTTLPAQGQLPAF